MAWTCSRHVRCDKYIRNVLFENLKGRERSEDRGCRRRCYQNPKRKDVRVWI
jgi:hypothetical protein